ncbi:hypothetical protein [Streptomyces sp. NPDC087300]|uniref:hypothetical protein n=1 Tax=Streptomyces sp. NPDC087300 TaxID=3365780 RepID=UPI00382B5994
MGVLLFLVTLIAAIAACGLFGYGCGVVVRRGPVVCAVAGLLGAVAAAAYAVGGVYLGLAVLDAEDGGTGSAPMRPCVAAGPERAAHVVGYEVELVPLGFTCVVGEGDAAGGGDYRAGVVPRPLNLVVFGGGVLAAGVALSGAYAKHARIERDAEAARPS